MIRSIMGAAALATLMLTAACGPSGNTTTETPAATTEAAPAAAPETAAEAPAATEMAATDAAPAAEPVSLSIEGHPTGDPVAGKKVFAQCMACHVIQAGQNRVGPSLYGVIGRTAGSVEGFRYSDANKGSGIVWTEQALFDYLENPRQTIPGTIMAFAGLKKPEDRANVIAYIKQQSAS